MTALTFDPGIEEWLVRIGRAEVAGFEPTTLDDLQSRLEVAYAASSFWLQSVLKREISPYGSGQDVRRSYHRFADGGGTDMLRHEYVVDNMQLVVLETPNRVLVRVGSVGPELRALDVQAQLAEVRRVAALLFHPKLGCLQWQVRPTAQSGALAYSTNPHQPDLHMSSTLDRMDAGVWQGSLYFVNYNVRMGSALSPRPGNSWFKNLAPR